jgi:hypothetical protein
MPKFLDVHPLKGVDEETLRKAQKMPKDEFGITHDIFSYVLLASFTTPSIYRLS